MASVFYPNTSETYIRTVSGSTLTEFHTSTADNMVFFLTGSNYGTASLTASFAISSSYAKSASWAPGGTGTTLTTGSTYPITASFAISASNANSASYWATTWGNAVGWQRNSDNATDTNEVSLTSLTIPGGLLGANDVLRIWTTWTWTNSASTKRAIIELGTVEFLDFGTTPSTVLLTSVVLIANRNSTSNQVGGGEFSSGIGTSGFDVVSSSLDMTANQLLDFRCRWTTNTGSEYIRLERYLVEVIPVGRA